MFCSNCGAQVGTGNFCASCGAPSASQPNSLPPAAPPVGNIWASDASVSGQSAYAPQVSFASPINSKRAAIFSNLGRASAGVLALGFVMMMLNPLTIPGYDPSNFLGFHTFALVVLTLAGGLVALLKTPTWGKWLAVSILTVAYWIGVRLLDAMIRLGSSFDIQYYEFSSPSQLLFEAFENFEPYLEYGGPVSFSLYLGSLVLMQIAPTLATIAVLGSTIVNKKLS